jgi:hypothetical protein
VVVFYAVKLRHAVFYHPDDIAIWVIAKPGVFGIPILGSSRHSIRHALQAVVITIRVNQVIYQVAGFLAALEKDGVKM